MRFFLHILIVCIVISSLSLLAQEYDPNELEEILESITQETDKSYLLDVIERFTERPLIISESNATELSQIPGFYLSLSERIIELVNNSPKISYKEISDTLSLSREQIYLLRLCTILRTEETENLSRHKKNLYIRLRQQPVLNDIKGFKNGDFLGSKLDLYQRSSLYFVDNSAGILTNKDAGERNISDFVSAYLDLNTFGIQVIIGDFCVEKGMGSILSPVYSVYKGAEAIAPVVQKGDGIKPYRSTIESGFFRGVAGEKVFDLSGSGRLTITGWLSTSPRSATLDSVRNVVSSIGGTGYFRTSSEISKKNSLQEKSLGGSLEWSNSLLCIGASAFLLEYDKPIESESNTAFFGKSGVLSSFYSFITFPNKSIGLEISRDAKNNLGYRAGIQFENKMYDMAFNFRAFPSEFRSPFGNNFGESSTPSNEIGLYSALRWKSISGFLVTTYIDIFRTFERTYTVEFPVRGIELFTDVKWNYDAHTALSFRLRYENKTDSYTEPTLSQKFTYQKSRYGIRFEIKHNINSKVEIRCRAEGCLVSFEEYKTKEYGAMFSADLLWQPLRFLKMGGRITYFSTESYYSAIWLYEGVVPGMMSTTALFGEGMRTYIVAGVTPFEFLSLWARYTITSKNNINTISSGVNQIDDYRDRKLVLQLDISL